MSEVLNPELSSEHFDTAAMPRDQEAIDNTFYALVESLDAGIEEYETLKNESFLSKPEAPGDLFSGKM